MKSCLKLSLTLKICILLFLYIHGIISKRPVYSIRAEVGAGNITHYALKQEGSITLILDSITGDADIYVSEKNVKPDYTDYDLQSVTCGQDMVTVPKEFKRPVGIGIFGHVYHPVSKYELTVILDHDGSFSDKEEDSFASFFHGEEGTNESTLWVIFVNILKLIIEILA